MISFYNITVGDYNFTAKIIVVVQRKKVILVLLNRGGILGVGKNSGYLVIFLDSRTFSVLYLVGDNPLSWGKLVYLQMWFVFLHGYSFSSSGKLSSGGRID